MTRDRFQSLTTAALLLAIGLVWAGVANAAPRATPCDPATPDNALCLTGTAPTLNTDGTPITLPLIYRVQQKVGTGSYVDVATGLTSLQYYAKNLVPGDYLFKVFANCVGVVSVVNCSESAGTTSPGKTVATPTVTPQAPVIIIAATIRAGQPPIYRVVYTVRPRADEVVFVAPESMRGVFAAR